MYSAKINACAWNAFSLGLRNIWNLGIWSCFHLSPLKRDQQFGGGSLTVAVAHNLPPYACLRWAGQQSMNELIYSTQPTTQTPGWAGGVWNGEEEWKVGDVPCGILLWIWIWQRLWGCKGVNGEAMWQTAAACKKNTKSWMLNRVFLSSVPLCIKCLSLELGGF